MKIRMFALFLAAGTLPAVHVSAQDQSSLKQAMGFGTPIDTPEQKDALPLLANGSTSTAGEGWGNSGPGGRVVQNVTVPTLTPYLPDPAKATGAAVIVAPGGGFYTLAIDNEGHSVARWLADRGIAAFVLKYRLRPMPKDPREIMQRIGTEMGAARTGKPIDPTPEAVADAQAAMRLVRSRAATWRLDPNRVGFVGFSAGAMTALGVALAPDRDARPNFIAPIYPPMMARSVANDAPPMFLAIALDDPLFAKGWPLGLIESWRQADRPLEVHLYERGGHGFGMSSPRATAGMWAEEFYAWMKDRGLLKPN